MQNALSKAILQRLCSLPWMLAICTAVGFAFKAWLYRYEYDSIFPRVVDGTAHMYIC